MVETVVCVGAVVRKGAEVLLVRQAAGHSLAGQWTIPWGRLDRGESPAAAAVRETWEEGGIVANVSGLLGVQELPPPWPGWLALIYECQHVHGEPRADEKETDRARYFSETDFSSLREPIEPWSHWLITRVFAGAVTIVRTSDAANPFQPMSGFI